MTWRWPIVRQRTIRRTVVLMIALVLGVPPIYMAVATPPAGPVALAADLPDQDYDLYVANWGYHTSVIVEQPQGWALGPPGSEGAAFIEYSWGDREFYMEFKRDPVAAVKAFLLPTDSVIFVRGWTQAPSVNDGMERLYQRSINRRQWRDLILSLERDVPRTPTGYRVKALEDDTPYQGQFYPGREFYIGWSDCNAWTVRHLAKIDVAQDAWGIIVAEQVAPQLRGFNRLI